MRGACAERAHVVTGARGIMRAVSGPRVIVVGAGVYGLAAARRLALAGADVTVLEAREAGRVVRRLGRLLARAALRVRRGSRTTPSSCCGRGRSGASSSGCSASRSTTRPACSGSRSSSRSTSHDSLQTCEAAGLPVRLLEPAEAARRFPAFSLDGVAAVLHDAEGGVLQARARDARPGAPGARRRARRCARGSPCARSATASSSSPTARSEAADQVLVATGAWTGGLLGAPIRSTQQVNVYLRMATAGLPVWTYDLDVYGLARRRRRGSQGRRPRVGPDVDPDDAAAREAPRGRGAAARRRGAPAATGPRLARRRRARARRRRLLLRADGDRGADRRPRRRAHRRVRRLLGPRLQVRADGRGRAARSRAGADAGDRPGAVPLPRRLRRSRRASRGAGARRRATSTRSCGRRSRPARAGPVPACSSMTAASARLGDQCLRASATRQRSVISRFSTESEEAPTWWTITASGVIAGWYPALRARAARSASSPYMKNVSSKPPSCSQTAARCEAQAARDDVDLARAVARPAAERLGVEDARAAEHARQPRGEADEAPDALRAPARAGVELAVRAERAAADQTRPADAPARSRSSAVSVSPTSSVSGLSMSTYSPCRLARTEVRAGREADVLLERDQADVGELAAHELGRAVARGVLDDDDLVRAADGLALRRTPGRRAGARGPCTRR